MIGIIFPYLYRANFQQLMQLHVRSNNSYLPCYLINAFFIIEF